MKVISTRMHGLLDYSTTVLLFAQPRLSGWSEPVTTLLTVMAVITLVYSLVTRYELGAYRAIPMRAHLALDFLSGALLLGAGLMLTREPDGVRLALSLLGLFEIGAAWMTDPDPAVDAAIGRRTRTRI